MQKIELLKNVRFVMISDVDTDTDIIYMVYSCSTNTNNIVCVYLCLI